MNYLITVVIAARNAEQTIERAVNSVCETGDAKILLVDDYSDDDTVRLAKSRGGDLLEVVTPREKIGLGNARQAGLESVDTPYLMWLDADDELLAGRLDRMLARLEKGADLVFDSAELCDGASGKFIKNLQIPSFLWEGMGLYRSFERNYLPGPAWPAARVEFARKVGYDPEQNACEDTDFILRALRLGAKWELLSEVGYRQFAYETSLSRDLTHQRRFLARAFSKHSFLELEAFLKGKGVEAGLLAWCLCSNALFRGDWPQADLYAREAFGESAKESEELLLPWRVGFDWLSCFIRGSVALLNGKGEAEALLERCVELEESPDALNNLGVVRAKLGKRNEAVDCFEKALQLMPGYLDARRNLENAEVAANITTHPLRRFESRSGY
ncbi:glycosyltransferase family 2 protein [Pelagicoccus mobilis]|uniref:Glycosyltransferase n=1 Tax=Pelagicoccus mobilis TaxID=415221 RepID=A0A934RZ75_9BACT|nr:glycosyltransferase [Pelagicoccus mobilis]MBK1878235.1 glycosyltransferase [Pelagicoccus mobilis]